MLLSFSFLLLSLLTLPLSSNFVSMMMTEHICSHIMRQKSSNVSISGPRAKMLKKCTVRKLFNSQIKFEILLTVNLTIVIMLVQRI